MKRIALASVLALAACQGGSGNERSAVKVADVERTRQSGTTTVIERMALRYDGSKVAEVTNQRNGAPNGVAKLTYGKSGIERIEYTDKEGDRATDTLTYTDGNLTRLRFEIPGVSVTEQNFAYFAEDKDTLKEVATTNTSSTGLASSQLTRYEYDGEGRAAKITTVAGTTTSTRELRYNVDGQLDRATQFSGSAVVETYTYNYLPDGKLDEVVDSKNNRYELTYDKSGKITEIRHTTTTGTITTTRYTYAAGSTTGWSFAPELPTGDMFDLSGKGFTNIDMLHGGIPEVEDLPKASGGGGGGGGGVCEGFTPQDACDTCLANSCCSQTKNCLQGTACYAFFQCAQPCTTEACQNTCRSQHPAGASAYDSFSSCATSFCSSQCQ